MKAKTDIESNNAPGSLLTWQWPETRHLFQYDKLVATLESDATVFVSEKIDGSNISVSSDGVIASRRCVLLNNPSPEEMTLYKFSGVSLRHLTDSMEKTKGLNQEFVKPLFPTRKIETIAYGELVLNGTAQEKKDIFAYREKGMETGRMYVFGVGIRFRDDLTSVEMNSVLSVFRKKGFRGAVISTEGRSYIVLALNDSLNELLTRHGFHVPRTGKMTVGEMIDKYNDALVRRDSTEGVVVVTEAEGDVLKLKSAYESYPQLYVEKIKEIMGDSNHPLVQKAMRTLLAIAETSRGGKMDEKSLTFSNAFRSAKTKFPTRKSNEDIHAYAETLALEMRRDLPNVEISEIDTFVMNNLLAESNAQS